MEAVDARSETLSGTAVRFVYILAQAGVGVLLIPISLAFLSRDDYGVYVIVRNVGSYAVLSAEIGLGQSIFNFCARAYARGDADAFHKLASTGFVLYGMLAAIVWTILAISMAVVPWAALLLGSAGEAYPDLPRLLFAYATLSLLAVPLNVFPAALLAIRKVTLRQVIDLVGLAALVLGTVVPLALGWGLAGLVVASGLAPVVVCLSALSLLSREHTTVRISWSRAERGVGLALLRNSVFFLFLGIGLVVQRTVGSLVLAQAGPLDRVPAMYALMLIYRVFGWSILETVSRVSQPYVILMQTRGATDRIRFYTILGAKLTTFAATAIVVGLSACGVPLLLLVGIPVSWPELILLGLPLLFDAVAIPVLNVLTALNRHVGLAFVQVAYAAISFVLGIAGAAALPGARLLGIGTGLLAAAVIVQVVLMPLVAGRPLGVGAFDYLRRFVLVPLAAPALVVALATPLVAIAVPPHPLTLLGLLAVAAVAEWSLVLTSSERGMIRALVKR